jgi:hypothetical protein
VPQDDDRRGVLAAADELRREAEQAADWALREGLCRSAEELERRAGRPALYPVATAEQR